MRKSFHELVVESLLTKNLQESFDVQTLPHPPKTKEGFNDNYDHLSTEHLHKNLDHIFKNGLNNARGLVNAHVFARNMDSKGLDRAARMSDNGGVHHAVATAYKTSSQTLSHIAHNTKDSEAAVETIRHHNNTGDITHHVVMNVSKFPKQDHRKIYNAAIHSPNTSADMLRHISFASPEHKNAAEAHPNWKNR